MSRQKGGGTVSYLPTPGGAQNATSDLVREVLGDAAGKLRPCVGPCGLLLATTRVWAELDTPKRKRLLELGVRRGESLGRCKKCTTAGVPAVVPQKAVKVGNVRNRIDPELMARLPQIWEEVRDTGGGQLELARRLKVTRQRAAQLINEHSLPRKHASIEKAAVFLEELEHLAGLGQGVAYIARALQMEPDALVTKVNYLYRIGKTAVNFHGWSRHVEKEAA